MRWSCVGHDEQKAYVERLLHAARFPHALLLAGPGGIGKRMFAEDVITSLVPAGYAPDIVRLTPERDEDGAVHDIPVAAVRAMKEWLSRTPVGARKAILIDDAELLGADAANTLLKVLEEPPAYAYFILVTGRPHDILPTIASRCERIEFRPLPDAVVTELLGARTLDAADRALLAAVAGGRPGFALHLADNGKLTDVAEQIGVLERALKGGLTERLLAARDVAARDDAPDVTDWWLSWVHSRLAEHPRLAPVAAGLLEARGALHDTAANQRLALERFFLGLP